MMRFEFHHLLATIFRAGPVAVLCGVMSCLPLAAYTNLGNNVLRSDGSVADTQAAINAATNGGTVRIPAGTFAWTSGVSLSGKGIKLQGAGASQYLGWSATAATIGTGSKTFTTQSGLAITVGQSLRIQKTGGETNNTTIGNGTGNYPWMVGTVTSYSGTTLVINIASTNYSGTWSNWYIATLAQTTLINNTTTGDALIALTENTGNTAELADFRMDLGTGTVDMVRINSVAGGKPVQIHDCWLQCGNATVDCIQSYARAGIVYRTVLEAPGFSMAPTGFHHKMNSDVVSWATASAWGSADTTGTANFYFEDCTFIAFLNATDFDDNSRCSIRHCFFDHAGIGTHGADTGSPAIGCRYFDVSDCEFHYVNNGNQSLALNWWFYIRGGTFAVHDCIIPQIDSGGWWGNKSEFNMTVMNLQRNAGSFPIWGDNVAGNQYPAPRQIGRGNPNGTASTLDPAGIAVMGDLEPAYIWNNTGSYDIGLTDYGADGGIAPDSTSGYVVAGRDYYNNGTAKPGYAKYPYPHPLRLDGVIIAPSNAVITITVE